MSKKAEVKARRKRAEQTRKTLPRVLGGLAILLIVGVVAVLAWPQGPARPNANGTSAGDPNAPVKVQVFSDYQ